MKWFRPTAILVAWVASVARAADVAPAVLHAADVAPAVLHAADVAPAVLQAEAERVAVMAKVKDTVLAIFSAGGGGGGSGVVISPDGVALTNFHVTQPCGAGMKCGMADGKVYDAVIVGVDPTGDVAMIKLFGGGTFPCAELGDSDRMQAGDSVFAMGNPFLLATDFQPTVTFGILSGVRRYQYPSGSFLEYADCLQTDASINPGNSGGPLFDMEGKVIGINGRASFEKRGRVSVGAGYAISINQIKNFLGHLQSGRIVDHATLGAVFAFDQDRRVTVSDILDQSDAYRRGLRYGDELLSFGGRAIDSPNAFKNALGIYPKGWRVPLSYRREGVRRDITVRLAALHTEGQLVEAVSTKPRRPPMPDPRKPGGPEKPPRGKSPPEPAPKDRAPDSPPEPDPHGPPHGLAPPPPPAEVVKKHYEEKRGFVNYYFNRWQRDRVWRAWVARADMAPLGPVWAISGEASGGTKYAIEVAERQVVLQLQNGETKWSMPDELGSSLLPAQSGGLFAALALWRRMAVEGPEKFGDVWYLGTAPLPGREGLFDVLVGLFGGVEARFFFDRKTGLIAALEMSPEENADPCELSFFDYRESAGRWLPGRMDVRFGDQAFAQFRIDRFGPRKTAQP
jgi:serine protease Do